MKVLLILLYILHIRQAMDSSFHFPEENFFSELTKLGQNQYEMIQQRSTLPKIGECWKIAVLQLTENCKLLTEEKQQDLSLNFMNCFLEMSGHSTYSCIGDKKPNLRRICINSMSDRAFNVYAEFYSHTQSMCFYLYNRIWHERAEETINLLNYNSIHVNEQLEIAKDLQNGLLEHQREGLRIQNELIQQGKKLSSELETSHIYVQSIAKNFTAATEEQMTLLFNIFSKVNSLQRWALGEMSWISSLFYNILYLMSIMILSSSRTTERCRFSLLMIFISNLIIEYFISYYISSSLNNAEFSQICIKFSKSIIRYASIILCFCTLIKSVISYKDYNVNNNQILSQLQEKTATAILTLENIQKDHQKILIFMNQVSEKYKLKNIEKEIEKSPETETIKYEIGGNTLIADTIITRSQKALKNGNEQTYSKPVSTPRRKIKT